jgi:hypothetical protein
MSGIKTITLKAIANMTQAMATKINKGSASNAGGRLATLSSGGKLKDYRIDQGEIIGGDEKRYNAVLQINAAASSPGQKSFISKHSTHAKLAKVEIDRTSGDVSLSDLKEKFKAAFLERENSDDWT